MIAIAALSFIGFVTGLVCVNRATTPAGANYSMWLAGVGFVALVVTAGVGAMH